MNLTNTNQLLLQEHNHQEIIKHKSKSKTSRNTTATKKKFQNSLSKTKSTNRTNRTNITNITNRTTDRSTFSIE